VRAISTLRRAAGSTTATVKNAHSKIQIARSAEAPHTGDESLLSSRDSICDSLSADLRDHGDGWMEE
jgi:hypothetical protein